MVITIQDDDQGLTDLLWVRELYALTPPGADLPPHPIDLGELPATTQRLRRDKTQWEQAWTTLWFTALDKFTAPGDLPPAPVRSAEAIDALSDDEVEALMAGPSWRQHFDDVPFDDAYDRWLHRLGQRRQEAFHRVTIGLDPERQSLDPLIRAWRQGLTTIVTVPCTGTYTRTLGSTTLMVTEETRADPARYSDALDTFTPGQRAGRSSR